MNKNITPAALTALFSGQIENFISASTPGGIEAQEKAGQTAFVNGTYLPQGMLGDCSVAKLTSMGIKFGKEVDDLFIEATLPEGWKKVATDHDMWSTLLDDKGRIRARIFYKAAFYDRSAHIEIERRYRVEAYREVSEDTYQAAIMDGVVVLHDLGTRPKDDYPAVGAVYEAAEAYMQEHYPLWKDSLAYWD